MMCAMVKKGLLGAALGTGALFLVFGTSAPSYVKTAFHKVRQQCPECGSPAIRNRSGTAGDRRSEADVRSEQGNAGPGRDRGRAPREGSRRRFRPTWIARRRRSFPCVIRSRRAKFGWPATSRTPRAGPRPNWPIASIISGTRRTCSSRRPRSWKPSGGPSRLLTSNWPICKSRSRPCWPSWPRSKPACR